ncbi:MAG: hypothetical protein AAF823_02035 [Planctomycetota bacterium]
MPHHPLTSALPTTLLAAALLTLPACNDSANNAAPNTQSSADATATDTTADAQQPEEWEFYDEPYGDESSFEFRFDSEPQPGRTTTLELRLSTGYGPLDAKVWVRFGFPDEVAEFNQPGPDELPDPEFEGWIPVQRVGYFYADYAGDDYEGPVTHREFSLDLIKDINILRDETTQEQDEMIYGSYTLYSHRLSMPTDGKPVVIEVLTEQDGVVRMRGNRPVFGTTRIALPLWSSTPLPEYGL